MPTFVSVVGFAVLLASLDLCETWRTFDYASYQNKNKRLDHIHAFSDEGFVDVEVSGKHYVVRGSEIFVEESYGDSGSETKTLIPTNVGIDFLSGNSTGINTSDTVLSARIDANDMLDFWKDIQMLSLDELELRNISSRSFDWLSSSGLQYLSMRYTDIEIVAEDTLEPVQDSLWVLDLSNANISPCDLQALMQGLHNDTLEDQQSNLIILSLANLRLQEIPYEVLSLSQYSLHALSLHGNDFATIGRVQTKNAPDDYEDDEFDSVEDTASNYFTKLLEKSDTSTEYSSAIFPPMPLLIILDLRQCNISVLERGAFSNLVNLRSLYISDNDILILPNFVFEGLTNLAILDMSFNRYRRKSLQSTGLRLRNNSFAELYFLRTMNLSYTAIHSGSIGCLNRLPPSLITLELRANNLSNFKDGIFEKLNNLQVLNLSLNPRLASDLTTAIFAGLDMLQELYMSRTSLQSLEALQELSSLKVLDVHDNSIATFEEFIDNFPLLEHLDISGNYIQSWRDERAFTDNSKLQSVYLHNNIITLISNYMLEDFKSLSVLTLANNNLVCNCQLKEFMEYLIDMNDGMIEDLPILIDYQSNGATHVCTDATLSTTIAFTDTDSFCVAPETQYWISLLQHLIYISLLVSVCSVSLGGLIYWKWWYIRYVAVLLKNATVLSMINVENCEDRIYLYDIFVSYADADRNWVIEELIPNIEGPEARLRICLHERDFQVGVSILENIVTGMDQSRTILLIISGCFIKSQWCQFEMHMAQHRLLETCREELVLVLLEEIPRWKRPKTLHYLMMVKTYIVWPKESDNSLAKKLFWKRLRRAITANKSKPSSVA